MSNRVWTILFASAVFAAIAGGPAPAAPTTGDALPPATSELEALDRLASALRGDLHVQQQRLDSGCEFAGIRARLIEVRDEAIAAVERLARLWRDGRLHAGGLAMSEVLTSDFAALVNDARRDTALADTLATLEEETRQGSGEARALLRRMIEIHPAAPACLSRGLDEPERGDLAAVRVLERALSIDSLPDSLLVIRGVR